MKEEIQEFINNNITIKKFLKYPKEEMEIIRMFVNLELTNKEKLKDNVDSIRTLNICLKNNYNCLDFMVSYRCKVERALISPNETFEKAKKLVKCQFCNATNCIRKSLAILIEEIDNYNNNNSKNLQYLDVIDGILNKKIKKYSIMPDVSLFKNVDIIDLLYIQAILEAELISIKKHEKNIIEAKYLDISNKDNNKYYINILLDFYKNKKNVKELTIDLDNIEKIFKEKDEFLRKYKIAVYYKYLMEVEKQDIIKKLREFLKIDNLIQGISVRTSFFIHTYFQKVEELPYSKKTKDKIYNVLNYILNYRFKTNTTPYIPINILIYSNDKEGVEKITRIIGEFMWYFGYLSENIKYYNEYMNNIILDKYTIKRLYIENIKEEVKNKNGILLLHNFENLLYTEYMQQNLILNILTDEMERNNRNVCTIIYGDRTMINQLLGNHQKLSQMLLNLELEIDNLDIDKVFELVISKLERNISIPTEVKEKIYNYIKVTYKQSDTQNMEYVNKLYNLIILNMNIKFSTNIKQELKLSDIPEAYNTKDLPEIMKSINDLVGLREIKEQINDLVALLKFNNKANLDIKDFNLHMCFMGNPGTGKTTVARLVTEIFYNLGYIKQNKLTEVTAKDLIAEYLGQTSGKTYNVVKSALGGVLFIDEAYAITSGIGRNAQYGNECIATLLKLMEDYKDRLIIIFAGYQEEMQQFLDANSGLISRIGYKISFPDYTVDELTKIYTNLLKKNQLIITDDALEKLKDVIRASARVENFGNGRYIHNIFQRILIEHSKNIETKKNNKDLYLITEEDINYEKLIAENKNKKIGF